MKIDRILGHVSFLGHTGYSNHSRSFFTLLNKFIPTRIRNFAHCKDNSYLTEEQKQMLIHQTWIHPPFDIGTKYERNMNENIINIILMETNHYYYFDEYLGPKVAFNVWESTRQPDNFFKKLLEFDQLWVPTEWQKQCSIEQGYPKEKIFVIPEGVDSNEFHPLDEPIKHKDGRFKFFIFGRWDYRKATLEMIETFLKTFKEDEPVDLIISVDNPFPVDTYKNTEERLDKYGLQDKRIIIEHFPSREKYIQYLQSEGVFLSCSRSEGWNLPLIEAISCGMPTICSNYGAQLEFADGVSLLVNIKEMKKPENVFMQNNTPGLWAEPDFNHLSKVMRDAYENYDMHKKAAVTCSKIISEKFTWQNAVNKALIALNTLEESRPKKLNLGCGDFKKTGYINIDKFNPNADIKGDITKLNFEDETIDEIYTSHVLEHEGKRQTEIILNEIFRVLKPGGLLTIEVPDFESILKDWINSKEEDRWGFNLDKIFGHQENDGEYHKTAFSKDRLQNLLIKTGFENINISTIWSHSQNCLLSTATKKEITDEIFILDSYSDLPSKLTCLENQIEKLKNHGKVLLVSHYPVPDDIQKLVDYFIYDKNNVMSKDWTLKWWMTNNEVKVYSRLEQKYHSVAILVSLFNALDLIGDKFKYAHFVEYDIEFNIELYLKETRKNLMKNNFVGFYYDKEQSINSMGILTNLFSFKIDWFKEKFERVTTWEHYTKLSLTNSNKNQTTNDYIFENWFYNYLLAKDMIKDSFIFNSVNKDTIISNRNYFDQYDKEKKLKLLISEESENKKYVIFISNPSDNIKKYSFNYSDKITSILPLGIHYYIVDKKPFEIFRLEDVETKDITEINSGDLSKEFIDTYFKFFDNRIKCKPGLLDEDEPKINIHFVDGAFCEIKGKVGKYLVNFTDSKTKKSIYSTILHVTSKDSSVYARPNIKYFVPWNISVLDINSGKVVFEHELNLKDQRVLLSFDSKSLGDTLAHFPYAEEFRKIHGCKIIASTFWNDLFISKYPEITFIKPGTVVENLYAFYKVGCFDNDYNRNKNNWRDVTLQQIATDILGLDFKEIKPLIKDVPKTKLISKYVCIAEHSTMQCKYWNRPGGWQELVNYIKSKGYNVIVISKEETSLHGIIKRVNKTIDETISTLKDSVLFIGVGSGLAWLAWSLNVKTIMISGFSEKFSEMYDPNVARIINEDVCHGCYNDISIPFGRNWEWCPRNKNFECTKEITPEMIYPSIDKFLD